MTPTEFHRPVKVRNRATLGSILDRTARGPRSALQAWRRHRRRRQPACPQARGQIAASREDAAQSPVISTCAPGLLGEPLVPISTTGINVGNGNPRYSVLKRCGGQKGFPGPWNHLRLGAFLNQGMERIRRFGSYPRRMGTIVDQAEKKERRRKQTNAGKTMTQATSNAAGRIALHRRGIVAQFAGPYRPPFAGRVR